MKYTHVIITDENGKPMAWAGDQLCYCTNETWRSTPFPVQIYDKKTAKGFIQESIGYRHRGSLTAVKYHTVPVDSISLKLKS